MFEKVKQAIHVGRHVTDMMRLPCVYSCHKVLSPLWQGGGYKAGVEIKQAA